MPFYRVWYRDNQEPLEFTTAGITREEEILHRVFQRENIAVPSAAAPSLGELIERNNLGTVRYTVDESEPVTIS